MRVRAITTIYYSKHQYEPGEEYDMDDREEGEAKILHALGKIEIIDLPKQKTAKPAPLQTKVPEYQTRAMEPTIDEATNAIRDGESTPSDDSTVAKPVTTDESPSVGPGPRYRRRDVRAQR